ncbi:MAG: hypothetical protein AB7P99_07975 [Vicinamibacterales bacterium]
MEAPRLKLAGRPFTGCLLALALACGARDPHEISQSGAGAHEVSLAVVDDGFVASWYDDRDGNAEIYIRRLDAAGDPAGPELRLTTDPALSYEPDVTPFESDIAIGWYERSGDALTPRLGRWSVDGQVRWTVQVAPAGRNVVVRGSGDRLFAAWVEDDDTNRATVWGGWWAHDGKPIGDPIHLAIAGRTTWNLNADVDASGVPWVAYDAKAGTRAEELFLVRGDGAAPPRQLTADDGVPSKYPDVAFNGKAMAVTWFEERDSNEDVFVAVVSVDDDAPLSTKHQVTRNPGESIGAYLAWAGDRVGVAWSDEIDGQHDVHFQAFDPQGQPLGERRRITDSAASSLIPAIRAHNGRFALAWTEYRPGDSGGGHGPVARSEIAFTLIDP